jgi:hypothetical protein
MADSGRGKGHPQQSALPGGRNSGHKDQKGPGEKFTGTVCYRILADFAGSKCSKENFYRSYFFLDRQTLKDKEEFNIRFKLTHHLNASFLFW